MASRARVATFLEKALALLLEKRHSIASIVHFRYPVFEDPTVESCICVCQNEAESIYRRANSIITVVTSQPARFAGEGVKVQSIPQVRFEDTPENDFNVHLGTAEANIVETMSNGKVDPLGALCTITVGIKPYQVGKGVPKQTRDVVEKRLFDATYCKDATYRRYLMGRDIDRYVVAPLAQRWISYGTWLAEPRPAAPFFEPNRILIRQTGDSIIAALEDEQRLTLNNLHNVKLRSQPPTYEYLLAILNSRLMTYYHQQIVPEVGRTFAEVKIVDLARLPIPRISFLTDRDQRTQMANELRTNYEEYLSTGMEKRIIFMVNDCCHSEPEHTDIVHDSLTFLAERMMYFGREKQRLYGDFVRILEELGANLLKPKSVTDLVMQTESVGLASYLRKNKVSSGSAGFSQVEVIAGPVLEDLHAFHLQSQRTDRLIDQIVYQLYGLSEAEVADVEGKT